MKVFMRPVQTSRFREMNRSLRSTTYSRRDRTSRPRSARRPRGRSVVVSVTDYELATASSTRLTTGSFSLWSSPLSIGMTFTSSPLSSERGGRHCHSV